MFNVLRIFSSAFRDRKIVNYACGSFEHKIALQLSFSLGTAVHFHEKNAFFPIPVIVLSRFRYLDVPDAHPAEVLSEKGPCRIYRKSAVIRRSVKRRLLSSPFAMVAQWLNEPVVIYSNDIAAAAGTFPESRDKARNVEFTWRIPYRGSVKPYLVIITRFLYRNDQFIMINCEL